MNFLAPLFLLGAIAIIGPVIFHLIRRTTREKTPFSTLMFLEPTPPRITRRSRLENLWLLLLRCIVIGLLATAFARPFFRQKATGATSFTGRQRAVILIDTSASLRREGAWAEAVKKAGERIHKADSGDELALAAFDRSVRPLMTFEDWSRLQPDERMEIATQRLSTVTPTWFGTQLDAAMIRAAELLDANGETEPIQRKIIVVSDLQEGAALDRLQGYEWPRGTSVEVIPVGKAQANNVSVQWAPESEESQAATETQPLRLRVTNSVGNKREQFAIRWVEGGAAANAGAGMPAYVPAGQSRIVRMTWADRTNRTDGTDRSYASSLVIDGDDIPFDNTVYVLPPQPVRIPILYLGRKEKTDPDGLLYYLDRAFPKTRSQNIEIIANSGGLPVPAFQANEAQLVVIGESPSSNELIMAREVAKSGRIVLLPLASADAAAYLATLLESSPIGVTEAPVKDYALFGEIDFQHPFFAPFADPRFSDFTKIHFWKHRRIDPSALPGARVVAKFDRGDPAVLQVPLGLGSVVVFTSTWRPVDSQLALSSKFVPLLHALLEQSTDIPVTKAQYFVGDTLPMPSDPKGFTVRKPDGVEVRVEAGERFSGTDQPGIYTVSPGNRRFVVNLVPEESRLTTLPLDRFMALGVPLQPPQLDPLTAAKRAAEAQAVDLEGRQKVWRWIIATALGVLLIETLIAGKLSGANRSSTVPTS
jgi:Aerotolerance regulator N-terminal